MEIKKDTGHQDGSFGSSPTLTDPRRRVTYSLAQVIQFVNSKDLVKYLPDKMLNQNQIKDKWEGIAESIVYTNNKNDKHYAVALSREDMIPRAKDLSHRRIYHARKTNSPQGSFREGAVARSETEGACE